MHDSLKLTVLGFILMLGATMGASAEVSQADIDALKAGQEAIRKELAEIKKLVAPKPKPKRVADSNHNVDVGEDPVKGSADAPLTIIEYTDYQCPYCARHGKSVLPSIQKDYIDTGKVRYVLRDFPLAFHKEAGKAGEAAHCAGDQGKYWEMHDKLFENQKALGEDKLPGYAGEIGIDVGKFSTCLGSDKYKDKVASNMADGQKAGVRGTPSFLIGLSDGSKVQGKTLIRGAVGYADFKTAFDALLKEKN